LAFDREGRYCRLAGAYANWGLPLRKTVSRRGHRYLGICARRDGAIIPVAFPLPLIVPFGAGGPVDTLARSLSEAMRVSLGQPVIIENVTGASGTIGVGRAVRAAPDGYTVSIGNWPSHVVNGAIYTLPYDVLKDFEPVARLPSNPYVVVARKDLPATSLTELIAWLKAKPGQGDAGHGRTRLRAARERGLLPERHRYPVSVRAVSCRLPPRSCGTWWPGTSI